MSAITETEALQALRAAGVDGADSLISTTTPDGIVRTIDWWKKTGKGTGLLVWKLKQGGVDPVEDDQLTTGDIRRQRRLDTFAEVAEKFPLGAVTESHKRLIHRCHYRDECDGVMVVCELPGWPAIQVRCSECLFEASYPFSALKCLPAEPPYQCPSMPVPPVKGALL